MISPTPSRKTDAVDVNTCVTTRPRGLRHDPGPRSAPAMVHITTTLMGLGIYDNLRQEDRRRTGKGTESLQPSQCYDWHEFGSRAVRARLRKGADDGTGLNSDDRSEL